MDVQEMVKQIATTWHEVEVLIISQPRAFGWLLKSGGRYAAYVSDKPIHSIDVQEKFPNSEVVYKCVRALDAPGEPGLWSCIPQGSEDPFNMMKGEDSL